MYDACHQFRNVGRCNTAAVADYKPKIVATQNKSRYFVIELETKDILASLGNQRKTTFWFCFRNRK
jgi:phosphopantothenoylcysteine synthetase/decarboxylase